MPAPVALFVYKRPDHTRRTLAALAANALAPQTDVTVFADAPRNDSDRDAVAQTRAVVAAQGGFKSLEVRERQTNAGLATSITEGVSQMCTAHGRVIVMEDDLVTAPGFLTFMNAALDRYETTREVWHISGWNYPTSARGAADGFFWRTMNCWGWATWADRWAQFDKDPGALIENWGSRKIRDFNCGDREDFWRQVERNASGEQDTWAIFWYATIYERGGLCLNPWHSLVENIGLDGTGENSGTRAADNGALNPAHAFVLPEKPELDAAAQSAIHDFLDSRRRKPARHRRRLRFARWKKYGVWK